jgi:Fe-S cluster assembly iron-binding protein IscA
VIQVTDRAARYLNDVRARGEFQDHQLRVVVRRGAGGGLEYALHWVPPAQSLPSDLAAECGPIRLLVEIHSAAFLRDATLDYVDDGPEARGLRLETPAP